MTEQTVSSSAGSDAWAKRANRDEIIAYFPFDDPTSRVSIAPNLDIVYAHPVVILAKDIELEQERWDEAASEAFWRLDAK